MLPWINHDSILHFIRMRSMSYLYPFWALAPWGLHPMLRNLYVVYPIPTQSV